MVVLACVMLGSVFAVAAFLYFMKRDKGVRKRASNFGKFNVLPDTHHEVRPFYQRAQDNAMSGSESEDDLMVRTHRRDNEISESESGSDDDDPGRAGRLAAGLEAYKKYPKGGGTRGAKAGRAVQAEAAQPSSYHNEAVAEDDDNAIADAVASMCIRCACGFTGEGGQAQGSPRSWGEAAQGQPQVRAGRGKEGRRVHCTPQAQVVRQDLAARRRRKEEEAEKGQEGSSPLVVLRFFAFFFESSSVSVII